MCVMIAQAHRLMKTVSGVSFKQLVNSCSSSPINVETEINRSSNTRCRVARPGPWSATNRVRIVNKKVRNRPRLGFAGKIPVSFKKRLKEFLRKIFRLREIHALSKEENTGFQ